MLADTVVVPPNTEHVDKEISNPSIIKKTTSKSFRTDSPPCNKSNPYISGMDGFKGHFLRKEFPSRQPFLSLIQGDRVFYQALSHPGRSGLADVIDVL